MYNSMLFPEAPKLSQLYSLVLGYVNSVLANLPLLQEIDRRYSKGTNGKFTLLILVAVILLTILGINTQVFTFIIGSYYPIMRSIRVLSSLFRP